MWDAFYSKPTEDLDNSTGVVDHRTHTHPDRAFSGESVMTETLLAKHVPEKVSPLRHDAPGSVTAMPKPNKLHHIHIYSDVNYEAMVEFYKRVLNTEVIRAVEGNPTLTFLSFDDLDHRVVIIKRPGAGIKSDNPIGVSHVAFCYSSLGEIIYIYKRMKEWGYNAPHWCVNHGNSTSIYYTDPDGNEVETMVDNFTPSETQDYKRHYQCTEEFGEMAEGNFDPDKMVALYEYGISDEILMDREQVRRMIRKGEL